MTKTSECGYARVYAQITCVCETATRSRGCNGKHVTVRTTDHICTDHLCASSEMAEQSGFW